MTTCLGKSCSFDLLCVSIVKVCRFMCVLLSLLVLSLFVLVPDHCYHFILLQRITVVLASMSSSYSILIL